MNPRTEASRKDIPVSIDLGQPDSDLAVLLADPPVALLVLALRWLPGSAERARRAAAMGCAMQVESVDLTERRPDKEPGGKSAELFLEWLASKAADLEDLPLRIWSLHLACGLAAADYPAEEVLKVAVRLHLWFSVGELRKGGWLS